MSKELKKIEDEVMDRIRSGKVAMRPRIYFIVGSLLTFVGVILSIVSSMFFVGLIRFMLRAHGPMASYRLELLLSRFPWWAFALAVAGLFVGITLMRRYDFSYKISPTLFIVGCMVAIIIAGWLFDTLGFNDMLARRGFMRRYLQESGYPVGQGLRMR